MDDRKTILIVDDEAAVRTSLSLYLKEFNYQITAVESAEEALELLDRVEFDLGIIDIRLPGINGDALIPKAHARHPRMRFLIHTGSAGYELPEEVRKIGMRPEQVFQKPLLDLDILRQGIDRILHGEEKNE